MELRHARTLGKLAKEEATEAKEYKRGGAVGKGPMEREGMTTAKMGKVTAGGAKKFGEHSVQTKGHTRGKNIVMKRGGKC